MKKIAILLFFVLASIVSCEKEGLCEKCLKKLKTCGFVSYDFHKEAIDRCVAHKNNMEFLRFCEKSFRCEDIAEKIIDIATDGGMNIE